MANDRIQFPDPAFSPFKDQFGQTWVWNDVAWVRRGAEPGIGEAPQTSQQYARVHYKDKANPLYPGTDPEAGEPEPEFIPLGGAWELVQADEWYLGAFPTDPNNDNFGGPLLEGHTYWNTVDKTMYVYNGTSWSAFSGVSEIATLWEYRFDNVDLSTAGDGVPVILNVKGGDDHGNTPFDPWERGTIIITVYVDGDRAIERRELTPAFGDPSNPIPSRPSDEVDQIQVADFATLPATGVIDQAYVTLDTGYTWIWDGVSAYIRGGVELDRYDYTVDYENQTIRFIQNFLATSEVVVETGTLAASVYIKSTYTDASDWDFVKSDCDMGGETPDPTKLVTEDAISCFVNTAVEEAIRKSTQAAIGACFSYAGNNPPANAVACNSQEMSIDAYPILYARIGNIWNNFNGMDSPASGSFRAPPQEVFGFPLYYGGTMGAAPVGAFLPSQNKDHSHTNNHSHNGTVSTASGSHDHYAYARSAGISGVGTGGGGKTLVDRIISKATYDDGRNSANYVHFSRAKVQAVNAGITGSNVVITQSNAATGSEGGPRTRPDTAVMLMCIWVDVQD